MHFQDKSFTLVYLAKRRIGWGVMLRAFMRVNYDSGRVLLKETLTQTNIYQLLLFAFMQHQKYLNVGFVIHKALIYFLSY